MNALFGYNVSSSVCPHIPFPKPLDRFGINLVLQVCTKSYCEGLILTHIEKIQSHFLLEVQIIYYSIYEKIVIAKHF
jgi:hypothetical protein